MVGVGDLEVKLMGLELMVEVVVMVVGFGADAQLVMSVKVGWG